MSVEAVQKQVSVARREVEKALAATLQIGTDEVSSGRRDMLVGSLVKWLTLSLDGLEMARKAVVEFGIEGGIKK